MNFISKLKQDINNVQVLFQARNFMPFVRPLLLLGAVLLLIYLVNNNARETVSVVKQKIAAQQAEAENERDYKAGKIRYQNLLAKLPPAAQKNEWILLQIEAIANKLNLKENIQYNKGANIPYGILEISTATITGSLTYSQVGRLVESIENNPQFLRINKLILDRQDKTLGKINVKIEVYTAFLEEYKVVSKNSGRK